MELDERLKGSRIVFFREDFDSSLAQLEQDREVASGPTDEPLRSYLQAAALCRSFPADATFGEWTQTTAEVLLYHSTEASNNQRRLTTEAMQMALQTIEGSLDCRRVLKLARPCLDDRMVMAYTSLLDGDEVPATNLGELRTAKLCADRLRLIRNPPTLPAPESLEARQHTEQIYSSLLGLTAQGVIGREGELDELRRYVGVRDPESMLSVSRGTIIRSVRGLFSNNRQPPLLIHGPGGIGKSTVLAQFVSEHAQYQDELKFPLCFLDFERATLSPRDPFSILREMFRQLRYQLSGSDPSIQQLESALNEERARRRSESRSVQKSIASESATTLIRAEVGRFERAYPLMEPLARLAHAVAVERMADSPASPELPFLVIMDSFEEAQQRSVSSVRQLWDLFLELQRHYPKLRTVVSGRAPVEITWEVEARADTLPIKPLGVRDREQLMVRRGLPTDVARVLSHRLSGNPLTLQLAVTLYEKRKAKDPQARWLKEIDTGGWWRLFTNADELIQGQLYDRILTHVASDSVRRIAHPGLVLRRITADIIKAVLAGPCKLGELDDEQAGMLFEQLAREVDLVERYAENSGQAEPLDVLRHREDVRQIMLALVEHDQAVLVRQIETAAVAYYRPFDTPPERAEEIYHSLRLGTHPREVEPRWLPGCEDYLDNALEEVPLKAQSFLASKLDGLRALGDDVFRAADLVDWEALTANRAGYLIERGSYDQAAKMMSERAERSDDSPLLPLEARIALEQRNIRQAEAIIDRGLEATALGGDRQVRFELLVLAAELAGQNGEQAERMEMLEAAAALARSLAEHLRRVALLLEILDSGNASEVESAREQLAQALADVDPSELRGQPELVSRLAAHVPAEGPAVRRLLEGTDEDQLTAWTPLIASELQPLFDNEEMRTLVQQMVNEAGFRAELSDQLSTAPLLEQMGKEHKLHPLLVNLAATAGQLSIGNSNRLLGAITGVLAAGTMGSPLKEKS